MKKIVIVIALIILTSCEYKSSNRELTNQLIKSSYRKGWYDGVLRSQNRGFETKESIKEGFIVDSLKFEDLLEW